MHYLSGHLWTIIWVWAINGDASVGLFLLATGACAFELLENTPGTGIPMWSWLGYSASSYHQDAVRNSVSDILFSLAGWLLVSLVSQVSTSTATLGVLLGVAGALLAVWTVFFFYERKLVLLPKQEESRDPVVRIAATPMRPFGV